MITVIKNVDLIDFTEEYDVVLVGTNTYFTLTDGFQRKIKNKYPEAKDLNMSTKYGDINKLGTIAYTNTKPIICFCYISHGFNFRPDKNKTYVDYNSIEQCMIDVNHKFCGLNIATTIIGSSRFDGNGDKDKISEILTKNNENINLFIYDYYQFTIKEEINSFFSSTIKSSEFDKKNIKHWEELNKKLTYMKTPHQEEKNKPLIKRIREDVKKILTEK